MSTSNAEMMANRRKLLEAELNRYLTLLVEQYRPQKVLLFGSLASGETGEWKEFTTQWPRPVAPLSATAVVQGLTWILSPIIIVAD